MKNYLILFVLFLGACTNNSIPKYKNPDLPIEERISDLMKRMTIEEKEAQLYPFRSRDTAAFDQEGNYIGTLDTAALYHGVGSFSSRGWGQSHGYVYRAKCINGIQKYMLEKSRLGIPVFFMGEALHGYMAKNATSFPQAIGLGCSWDTILLEQVFSAAALEAASRGTRIVLSPVVDLARDPRWGRTEECYSEDLYLVSRLGAAAVFGFQGRDAMIDNHHVAVTLKHFAGHGQSEGGRNIAPVNFSEREFREGPLFPFEFIMKHANARGVMVSYNEWDGIPNHVNHKLLTEILRDEWGFTGMVMSDGGGMNVTYRDHLAAKDSAESGILSIKAGMDYDLGSNGCFYHMADFVKQGRVSEADLDRAVRDVLRLKFTLGLFENPYADIENLEKVTNSQEHKDLAYKAAAESMVLLKNDNNTLPFDESGIKTLAVIGPNAAGVHLGGYSNFPHEGISVLEGIQMYAKDKFKVLYSEGCKLTLNKECHWQVNENPILNDPENDKLLIAEAVKTAKQSDAVVLVIGENELICREGWSDSHLGDRDNLDLVGMQQELADAILKTGKPVVILLINGRPISINELAKKAPAILECWYPGQEGGRAVADVIFGKINPSGKLSLTFPRSAGQLPCYYDHKPSRFRNYVLADSSPLFPFGFGLSYTSFEYAKLSIEPAVIKAGETSTVTVEVKNNGLVKGDEIVELYIHDLISLPTRPVMELRDFARISLEPGESKIVTFNLTPDKLEAFGINMKREIQSGDFEVMVGKSSVDYSSVILKVE
ncbi:MAG: glycoside hydrolase family 3 C-terminal domain-containing protein [Bacteroidales bacterium]|nr:glycoside hydrolase family 3 C-terminal domain-containing protein [Bacteroidales bacterium]